MAWWHLKPKITKNFEELTKTYNDKYGHFDYSQDSRSLDRDFSNILVAAVGDIAGLNILVCGANSGYEIGVLAPLFANAQFTAVDISTVALDDLTKKFPKITAVHESMDKLPFKDKRFDLYLNCRAIHSTDVNIEKSIEEAIRVTSGKIVLSVSNGYLIEGKIVNGMYDYDLKTIDKEKPFKLQQKISHYLSKKYNIALSNSEAELFLVATPTK